MEVVAAVGGALLSASFEKLFDKLASPELRQFASKKEVRSQLQIWENMLPKIHAVLEDAEDKQPTSKLVGIWLNELRDLVYDLEDVLDEFSTEALRLRLKNSQQAAASTSSNKVRKLLPSLFTAGSSSTGSGLKFNAEMGSKLKKITTRLERIFDEKSKLDLVYKAVGGERSGSSDGTARPPTTSLPDPHVFGRDKDKKALLDLLLATEPTDAASTSGGGDTAVSVIPIQGMGGSGKTTLAQLLYNDEKVKVLFYLRAWVCVSDTFHIPNITKAILQSVGGGSDDGMTFDQLQVKLGSILSGKKFLIVLDDVWNENYEAWTSLHKPFRGVPGSKIVVTTRSHGVASIMGTCQTYILGDLSFDNCLSLFAQHALGETNFDGHPHLKDIGQKIVGKCKGLPLAAKTLGGLLRTKLHRDEWVNILESQIWHFPKEKSDILPALRLSYQHLPSQLKQCFAYCAVFPKDYEFDMNELVMLWMAEGFLPQLKREKHLQDVGVELFGDLLSRSLFQYSSKDSTRFVMHDLIHDLAQHGVGDICFHLDAQLERRGDASTLQKARHSSFICRYSEISGRFGVFGEGKGLRTLLALPVGDSSPYNHISNEVLNRLLSKLKHLRALSLSSYQISKVPESVNGLKHLRYLNLSYTAIRLLPEFVCSLLNLQTLSLRECEELEKLPTGIGGLTNLCHLDISRTPKLQEMPVGIGNLRDLRTLGKFIVRVGGDGLNIRELKGLSNLKGELSIQGLHNVEDFQQAREADLMGKKGLERLVMKWSYYLYKEVDPDVAAKVLELLQPHGDLKRLVIKFYCGREFPCWIGDPLMMRNMVELELRDCRKTTSLPSLGRLPLLKHLSIKGMEAVKSLGFEFYGCDSAFQALETLKFEDMLGWEKWCSSEREGKVTFPRLHKLQILNCPILIGECKFSLPSLCQMELKKCKESLLRCMIDLTSLTTLSIEEMSGLSCLPQSVEQRLEALEDLEMYKCQDLTSLWQSGARIEENLKCLKSVKIRSCPQFVSFFTAVASSSSLSGEEEVEESCEMPSGLVRLKIEDCCNLQKLPAEKMASLETMIVRKCPKIGAIQIEKQQEEGNDEIGFLWKLRHVEVEDCGGQFTESMVNGLMRRLQDGGVVDHLKIGRCDSIQTLGIKSGRGGNMVCTKLKRLEIKDCKNLVSLCNNEEGMADEGEDIGSVEIERLEIMNCPSLTTDGMKLPVGVAIKGVFLNKCEQLETLPEECIMSTSSSSTFTIVEEIVIWDCPNVKRLPDSLRSLTNLTSLKLFDCDGIGWFPESGLPIPNLKSLFIYNCRNMKSLPKNMHSLTSLEYLTIVWCRGVEFITEEQAGCLPPNLIHLEIRECRNMKQSMSEWGLDKLTSLQWLTIEGLSDELREDEATLTTTLQLPTSLRSLEINGFKKVESITSTSWGIQNLTSFRYLNLEHCPKLRNLPKEGLPPTLEVLLIRNCPIVAKKCSEGKGKYWPRISLIPYIEIH